MRPGLRSPGLPDNCLIAGDPAVFGNLPPHPAVNSALKQAVDSNLFNGMTHSAGALETRQCVARQLSKYPSTHSITTDVSWVG